MPPRELADHPRDREQVMTLTSRGGHRLVLTSHPEGEDLIGIMLAMREQMIAMQLKLDAAMQRLDLLENL